MSINTKYYIIIKKKIKKIKKKFGLNRRNFLNQNHLKLIMIYDKKMTY